MSKNPTVLFVMAAASTTPELSGKIAVPPAGMLSIAGYARQHYPDTKFLLRDFGAERLSFDQQVDIVDSIRPDIVGMAARSFIYPATIRLAQAIKKRLPDTRIIFGGQHPTLMPEDTEFPPCFDSVVRFEGERAFVELLRLYKEAKPWPKVLSMPYLQDLSHKYAWDIIEYPDSYARFYSPFNTDPLGSVVWSRGCPFNCFFCSGPALWKGSAPRVRYRSPESVVDELKSLRGFGVRRFFIHDDTANANLKKLYSILDAVRDANLGMTWGAAGMRANKNMTPEDLFVRLKQAGCRYVSFGIESGNPIVNEKINRKVDLEDVERALALARKHGLRTCGGFTLGHIWQEPDGSLGGETEEDLRMTVQYMERLIKKRLLWSIQLSVIDPVPGSALWDTACKHDLLVEDDWESLLTFDRVRLNFRHPNLTSETIDKYYKQAYRQISLSPAHILFLLSTVRSFRDLYGLVRTGFFVLKNRVFKQ